MNQNNDFRPGDMGESALPNMEALYIHIPFCIKKCNYCDFISYSIDGLPVKEYIQALLKEGKMYRECLSPGQKELKSIYVGGGTPTCLSVEDLTEIVEEISGIFPVEKKGEITVECNPQTVDKGYFRRLKGAGVNRLSVGAEAFDSALLKKMGRMHEADDIKKAVYEALEAGFTNINLDLIYGLPGHTRLQWLDTLREAASLGVAHISVYGLKLSELSPWGKAYSKGSLTLPDDDTSADMQETAMDYLYGHGYRHYEIANFALPGFFSIHNRVYWNNGNYLGLGLAASSHWENVRQTNCISLSPYIEELQRGRFPVADREAVDRETEMGETVFLGLRLLEGLNIDDFEKRFGVNLYQRYQRQVEKLSRLGLLERWENRIRLTKKGIFLANEVFIEFLP